MKLDRNAVRRLLSLNDAQLAAVITQLAAENGLDASALRMEARDMAAVRRALSMAGDADLAAAAEQIGKLRRGMGGDRRDE